MTGKGLPPAPGNPWSSNHRKCSNPWVQPKWSLPAGAKKESSSLVLALWLDWCCLLALLLKRKVSPHLQMHWLYLTGTPHLGHVSPPAFEHILFGLQIFWRMVSQTGYDSSGDTWQLTKYNSVPPSFWALYNDTWNNRYCLPSVTCQTICQVC